MASKITSQSAFSGARAEIWMGSTVIGRAQGVNGTYTITNIGIEEMGEAKPTAFVTVGSNVNFSVQRITKLGDDPMTDNILPKMDTFSLITHADMTFQIRDTQTDQIKYKITGCRADGAQTFGATPRSLFIDGMNFVGTGFDMKPDK